MDRVGKVKFTIYSIQISTKTDERHSTSSQPVCERTAKDQHQLKLSRYIDFDKTLFYFYLFYFSVSLSLWQLRAG